MTYDYNKLYGETPDALGQPTGIFVEFFGQLDRKNARVLDVGCGQGRDALFIARLGHQVVGVDLSPNGVNDLVAAAKAENLPIEGHVADITSYQPTGDFDVVLIDRTLHMLPEPDRLAALARLLDHVVDRGLVLIADERANIAGFKRVISDHKARWTQEYASNGYLFVRRD